MNYRQLEKDALFALRYGRSYICDCVRGLLPELPDQRELELLLFRVSHPFAMDLAACAETNS